MTGNTPTNTEALRATVREILRREWDPIGVYGYEGADDEYDSYIAPVLEMLAQDASADEIFKYLSWIEVDHMGLTGDASLRRRIADRLRGLLSP